MCLSSHAMSDCYHCVYLPVVPLLRAPVAADPDPGCCWLAGGAVEVSPVLADVPLVLRCGQEVPYCAPAVDVSAPAYSFVLIACCEKPLHFVECEIKNSA